MATVRFQQASCDLCGCTTYKDEMLERDEGLYCKDCGTLPPYSDRLYDALVLIQRLFKARFYTTAKPCMNCERKTLRLRECYGGQVCTECHEDLTEWEHEHEEEEHECQCCYFNPCRCDDSGPCEECGNPYECVCAELREDAYLARHRRICGHADCDGGCGVLDCGCIDKCKCNDHWDD